MPARGEPVSGDGPASYIYGSEAVESIKGLGTQGPGRLKTTQPAAEKEKNSQSWKHLGREAENRKPIKSCGRARGRAGERVGVCREIVTAGLFGGDIPGGSK